MAKDTYWVAQQGIDGVILWDDQGMPSREEGDAQLADCKAQYGEDQTFILMVQRADTGNLEPIEEPVNVD